MLFDLLCTIHRYWAVAVPVYLCTLLLLGYLVYLGLIFINTPPLSSVTTITGELNSSYITVILLNIFSITRFQC